MRIHIVKQDECIASIAAKYGMNWRFIYEHSANSKFREIRPNPNVIYEGDEIVIPDESSLQVKAIANRFHYFTMRPQRPQSWVFRLRLVDAIGAPIAGATYRFQVFGQAAVSGVLGDDGLLEAPVPAEARSATLELLGATMNVELGRLDPVSTISGAQARLNNLGFPAGEANGTLSFQTKLAVRAFQASQPDLQFTGEMDAATERRLLALHDNDNGLGIEPQRQTPDKEKKTTKAARARATGQ